MINYIQTTTHTLHLKVSLAKRSLIPYNIACIDINVTIKSLVLLNFGKLADLYIIVKYKSVTKL